MHRDHCAGAKFGKSADRFLRVHVNFPSRRGVISADGQQRDIDVVMFADLAKTREKRAVATMEERSALNLDREPAKAAMEVGQKTRAPVITRGEGNLNRTELHSLPI